MTKSVNERRDRLRAELETGFTDEPWAVGKVLCPAGKRCPAGLLQLFTPLADGRVPMHRRGDYGPPCAGARTKPSTPPLRLRPPAL